MAQASIAQREPSMEEILASIRRIIEDSEAPARGSEAGGSTDLATLRAEAANLQPSLDNGARDEAAFRAAFDDDTEELPAGDGRSRADHSEIADEDDPVTSSAAEAKFSPAASETRPQRPAAADPGPGTPPMSAASAPLPVADAAPPQPRAAILSETASRQVAAAFDELSVARFAATRTRGFDEMAEEMLRPMLQDWLDNNLPTMVERLVREEIERIARGGAR